jgi:hypothetical protein
MADDTLPQHYTKDPWLCSRHPSLNPNPDTNPSGTSHLA